MVFLCVGILQHILLWRRQAYRGGVQKKKTGDGRRAADSLLRRERLGSNGKGFGACGPRNRRQAGAVAMIVDVIIDGLIIGTSPMLLLLLLLRATSSFVLQQRPQLQITDVR